MSNLSQFFSGGGGGGLGPVLDYRTFTSSGTFTATQSGRLYLMAVGGGGGGGAGSFNAGSTPFIKLTATGGGAGELALDFLDVVAGQQFTITVGAAGAGGTGTLGANYASAGAAGGQTSVSGPNSYALTVAGGAGGVASINNNDPRAGGAGGTGGTGGSQNVLRSAGGRGGDVINASSFNVMRATGGGAVNWTLNPLISTNGGDVAFVGSFNGQASVAGGGGVGGSASPDSISAFGPSLTAITPVTTFDTTDASSNPIATARRLLASKNAFMLDLYGTQGSSGGVDRSGCGGLGTSIEAIGSYNGVSGGYFAGGGAIRNYNSDTSGNSHTLRGGNGVLGGGGGAAVGGHRGYMQTLGGNGGAGCVLLVLYGV